MKRFLQGMAVTAIFLISYNVSAQFLGGGGFYDVIEQYGPGSSPTFADLTVTGIHWNGREAMTSPADDQWCIKDTAGTSGFCISTATDAAPALLDKVGTAGSGSALGIPGPVTKGQTMTITSVTANCTFAGGGGAGTCTTGAIIPRGAAVLSVTGRQVTPSTTCTTCTIGSDANAAGALDADQYGTALECDVNDTLYTMATATANWTAGCFAAAGCTITMTAAGGNCVSGVGAFTVHYIAATAATSD